MDDIKMTAPQPKKPGTFKKMLRWFLFFVTLGLGLFIFWKYYYTYSDGIQSGKMQKISHKGNIFKTWEGYLLISLSTTDNNISLTTREFPFTVPNDSIAHVLENYEGKKVKVRYHQKNGTLAWRGDTEYLVYEVLPDQ